MRLHTFVDEVLFACVSVAAHALDAFWSGAYKLNSARSKFSGATFTLSGSNAKFHYTNGPVSYDDGSTSPYEEDFKRVSGGPGFVGTWMSTKASFGPEAMVMATEADGLRVEYPTIKQVFVGKLDGFDVKLVGTDVPEGTTWSLKQAGPNKIDWTTKYKGKLLQQGTYTLTDGSEVVLDEGWGRVRRVRRKWGTGRSSRLALLWMWV